MTSDRWTDGHQSILNMVYFFPIGNPLKNRKSSTFVLTLHVCRIMKLLLAAFIYKIVLFTILTETRPGNLHIARFLNRSSYDAAFKCIFGTNNIITTYLTFTLKKGKGYRDDSTNVKFPHRNH